MALEATKDEKKSDAIVPIDRQVWQILLGEASFDMVFIKFWLLSRNKHLNSVKKHLEAAALEVCSFLAFHEPTLCLLG